VTETSGLQQISAGAGAMTGVTKLGAALMTRPLRLPPRARAGQRDKSARLAGCRRRGPARSGDSVRMLAWTHRRRV